MGIRDEFLAAVPVVRSLVAGASNRWDESSVLAGMSIGALAGHAARAVTLVPDYLGRPVPEGAELLDAAAYYVSIPGLAGGAETDINRSVRERADTAAASGPVFVIEALASAATWLDAHLSGQPADRRIAVFGDRVMLLDDYLITRLIEIVVHGDDLAVSLGIATPPFAGETTHRIIRTLVDVAIRTHGPLAVIVAMARRERDRVQALRIL